MIAQKYRLTFPKQTGLSPSVNRALAQQLTNADEMFETLFTESRRLASMIIDGGIGNVSGPAGATANAIVLFDGATGTIIRDSLVLLTDLATTHHHTTHELGGSDAVTLAQSQITNLVTDLALKAALASPAFTGIPTAPTASIGTDTTQIATTAYVLAAGATPGAHHASHETGGSDALTSLSAAILTSGTLANARLAANVVIASSVSVGTTPAALGAIRLPYGGAIYGHDLTTGNARILGVGVVSANTITIGDGGYSVEILGSPITMGSVQISGQISMAAGTFIYQADGTALIPSLRYGNEPTLGFYRVGAGVIGVAGSVEISGTLSVGGVGFATKAPLASPALTGTPTAPTAAPGTNTTQLATTAFVTAAAAALLPISLTTQVTGTLQAAQEPAHTGDVTNSAGSLALAIGASKVTNAMLAGSIAASKLVGTDIVLAESQVTNLTTDLAAKAPLASPALTGTPTAPTASAGTSTTQLATTAFVQTAISPAITTWVPVDASGAGLTLSVGSARYVVLGSLVFFMFDVTYPATANTANATVGGLPFAANGQGYGAVFFSDFAGADHVLINNGVTTMLVLTAAHAAVTNVNLSGKILRVSGWHFK